MLRATKINKLRKIANILIRTPLHPQWLLGRRNAPDEIKDIKGRILDVGAADRWLQEFVSENAEYIALDYPPTGHDLYHGKPDVFADGANLPFKEGSFDAVFCLEVMEHVADPTEVMKEIGRVLKPNGQAWISMPFLYPLHDAPFDFQRYTQFGLRRDAENAGLEVVNIQQTNHAVYAAGVLACLAISGGAVSQKGWRKWVLLPLASLIVFFINCLAWFLGIIWPDWEHMTTGHKLRVRKPL